VPRQLHSHHVGEQERTPSPKSQCLHPGASVLPAIHLRRRPHRRSARLRRLSRSSRQVRKRVVQTTTPSRQSPGMTGGLSLLHRRNRRRRNMRRSKLSKVRRRRGTTASLTRPRCFWTRSSNVRLTRHHHSCLNSENVGLGPRLLHCAHRRQSRIERSLSLELRTQRKRVDWMTWCTLRFCF
jgi:hypothetical protein